MELQHSAHSTYKLGYHFVWCPKYRWRILTGSVATAVERTIRATCAAQDWPIHACNVQPDHVHLFLSAPPAIAPAQIAHQIKGATAHALLAAFPTLRQGPGLGRLWSRSYYVGSVSVPSAAVVHRYILDGQD